MSSSLPKLYCSWFCPFAQRAWIALLYKGVKFEYVEQDPYDKSPEWLTVNPRGLVPTIYHRGASIYESGICVEYVDEAWPDEPSIMPEDPADRAYARIWADHINKKIVPHYYAALLKQGKADQEQAVQKFLNGFEVLLEAKRTDGPFFMGMNFGFVDIMVVPYMIRFRILEAYREFKVPSTECFGKLHPWMTSLLNMSCVKGTMPDMQRLIDKYNRYAIDTAKTEVADAIRKGTGLP